MRAAGLLHLIALKLHATPTWDRAVQGKDHYDILALIRINGVETTSPELLAILERLSGLNKVVAFLGGMCSEVASASSR